MTDTTEKEEFKELSVFGAIISIIMGFLVGGGKGILVAAAYFIIFYMPSLSVIIKLKMDLIEKTATTIIISTILFPIIYYLINAIGIAVSIPVTVLLALIIFIAGKYIKKRSSDIEQR